MKICGLLPVILFLASMLAVGCLGGPRPDGTEKGENAPEVLEVDISAPAGATNVRVRPPENLPAGTLEETVIFDEKDDPADFSSIQNIIWQLNDIRLVYGSIKVDRPALKKAVFGDFFTIQFMKEGITGTAAPNNYFAPYSLLDENNIGLRTIVSTQKALMNDILIINGLTEADYYRFVQRVYRWSRERGVLYLHSKTEAGDEIVLSYLPEGT
jgi:heat shock protein HslJ